MGRIWSSGGIPDNLAKKMQGYKYPEILKNTLQISKVIYWFTLFIILNLVTDVGCPDIGPIPKYQCLSRRPFFTATSYIKMYNLSLWRTVSCFKIRFRSKYIFANYKIFVKFFRIKC